MLRRVAYVGLAALGAAVAFAVTGAGGANISELLPIQGRLAQLDANGLASCAAGSTQAIDVTLYSGSSVDQNGTGSDVFLWLESTGTSVRLTDHPTRTSFDAHVDNACRLVAYSTFTPPSTNDARLFDLMTGMEMTIATGAVVEDLSGDGRYVVTISQTTGQMIRHRLDGSEPPAVVTVDSAENPLAGSSFNASISADGTKVAFQNFQTSPQIYVRDISAGTTELISEMSGVPSGGLVPTINEAGTFVAYLRPGTFPETGILRNLATDMDVVLGPVDDAPDVNDAGTVALVTPAALDPADTNGENDAYTLTLGGDATWLSRPVGGAPMGGSYPFVGNVHVANGDAAALFTSNRTNLGGATGVETGYRATIGTTGGGGGGGSTSTSTSTSTPAAGPGQRPPAADLRVGAIRRSQPADIVGNFAPGERMTLTVEIENEGDLEAASVTLDDTLIIEQIPISVTTQLPDSVSVSATGCTVRPDPDSRVRSSIHCDLPAIEPGGKVIVTYTVSVGLRYRDTFRVSHHPVVATSSPEADLADNNHPGQVAAVSGRFDLASTGSLAGQPFVDLAVTTEVSSRPKFGERYAYDEPIEFVVEVVNNGTADAHDVKLNGQLADNHPERLDLPLGSFGIAKRIVPGSARPTDCTFEEGPAPEDARDRAQAFLRCDLGTLRARGGRARVTFSAQASLLGLSYSKTAEGFLVNVAEAFADERDRNNSDNRAHVQLELDPALNRVRCTGERPFAVVSDETCARGGPDDEEFDCTGARCFAGDGNDALICSAAAVCSGEKGSDRYRCSGERTFCSGGAEGDIGTCLEESRCKEDGSDDVMACAGAGTLCNAGAGLNTIRCTAKAVCSDGRDDSGSELVCRNATLRLGRGDHEVDATGCKLAFGAGDNALRGSGTNLVELEGAGNFLFKGGGRVFIDAINGQRNVVTCERQQGSVVHIDKLDVPRGCGKVLGADVFINSVKVELGDTPDDTGFFEVFSNDARSFGVSFEVGNNGPADATDVRVRAVLTLRGGAFGEVRDLLGDRDGRACSGSPTPEGEQVVIECSFLLIRKGQKQKGFLLVRQRREVGRALLVVTARAAEADHDLQNNRGWHLEGSDEFVVGAGP